MKGDNLGEFEELILLAVRRLDSAATGSGIQALLEQEADRRASLGAIYAALDRGERKGLVASWLGDPLPVPGGRRRRHYSLTRVGEEVLRRARQSREALWQEARGPAA
jgi:DNA-binding PadR family transcriptional regulator